MHKIVWSDEALDLLDKRDRFARVKIRKEFAEKVQLVPDKASIPEVESDLSAGWHATQLAGNRFTILWKLLNDTINVAAVVPAPFTSKKQIESAVFAESDGLLKLRF